MPGLQLGVFGGVKSTMGNGYSPTVSPDATATAKAFGQGYSATGTPSTSQALFPNDPFGIAFWGGIASLALLLFIRHSLPR